MTISIKDDYVVRPVKHVRHHYPVTLVYLGILAVLLLVIELVGVLL